MIHDLLTTDWHLGIRLSGPLNFRFILQPGMAIFLVVRASLKDAKAGKPAYFWAPPNGESGGTPAELKEGWKSMGKLFITASDRSAFKQYQRVGRAR
jgi:hypothetical protein